MTSPSSDPSARPSNEPGSPSAWFVASQDDLADAAARGPILDLACGRGRHTLACTRAGWTTLALDRNAGFLSDLVARAAGLPLAALRADVEATAAIPLQPGCLSAVLVFRFLSRPLAPAIELALQPGGILVYETFTVNQRALGWGPTRDAFLLQEGELATLFPGLETIAYTETRGDGEPLAQEVTQGDRNRSGAVARLRARKPVNRA